ncbi:MAG: hypothetical protein E6J34_11310 [Chloroflexi bacterium]|nr:MAG: hypothetical protein E6J34_11310 [Chloroflexota bacterium]
MQARRKQSQNERKIAARIAKRFFEAVLSDCGYDGWQVVIDPSATSPRVTQGARQIFLPEQSFTLEEIKHLLAHELAGHAARSLAGEHSSLGLLGIHTSNYLLTEKGLALYYEHQGKQQNGHKVVGEGIQWMTFAVGLASGVITPPQTFLSVATFFELLTLLHSHLNYLDVERQKAQTYARTYALSLCLRTYRGVPDLEQAGVCYLQDAVYLRGLRLIEQAVAEDQTVLERLAVGMCSLHILYYSLPV